MRSLKYLNTILTVLAVLLTINLWTTWQMGSARDVASLTQPAEAAGVPNAASQRKKMVDLLKVISTDLNEMQQTLQSGEITVKLQAPAGEDQ
ncbi:MAG: hypothetical protein ACOCTI_08175 [Phycisphaeraceae bacterium]